MYKIMPNSMDSPLPTPELLEMEFKIRLAKEGQAAIPCRTVMQTFDTVVKNYAGKPALFQKVLNNPGSKAADIAWTCWTWKQYRQQVDQFAKSLISIGFQRFDVINIIGNNSREWFVANFGAIAAGGVAAGIHVTDDVMTCEYVARHSKAKVIVCEGHEQLEKFLGVSDSFPHLRALIVFGTEELPANAQDRCAVPIYSIQNFLKMGIQVDDLALQARSNAWKPGHVCNLIYTSKTTEAPKAVMITNDNITWTVRTLLKSMSRGLLDPHDVVVSYLPLSNISAQIIGMHTSLCTGHQVYFPQADAMKDSLVTTLQDVRPTAIFGPPLLWEMIHELIEKKRGVKSTTGNWVQAKGATNRKPVESGARTRRHHFLYSSATKHLRKVKMTLGLDRCKVFCSVGDGSMGNRLLEYFSSTDTPIHEFWGRSETTGLHATNMLNAQKFGAVVWKPFQGTEHKIDAETGELMCRGRHVCAGYLANRDGTSDLIDREGWLHTGYTARINDDVDGSITITGRAKQLAWSDEHEKQIPGTSNNEVEAAEPSAVNSVVLASKATELSLTLATETRTTIDNFDKVVKPTKTSCFSTVDMLRSAIALDVVRDGFPLSKIKSPFKLSRIASNHVDEQYSSIDTPLIYCDQTASNRPLRSVELYIEQVCLPLYANTHTTTSATGKQSTAFVAEARQIVAEETNARISGEDSLDVVLFAGSGSTSAVELLIDCVGLAQTARDPATRPIIFVGPFEHHSNLIPWRESGCEIVMVPECSMKKEVDYEVLEQMLQKPEYSGRAKIGTFSAASNVTGKLSDVNRIAAILHQHGAHAFFDYATAAPYVKIDMNPEPSDIRTSPSMIAKDAIFLSPHKMIGGVGTPGILIVKKHFVSQINAPHRSGGGSVFYVTNTHHRFLRNRIERYEAGTPNIVGIMRTGLVFLLKRQAEQNYRILAEHQPTLPSTLEDFECMEYKRVSTYLKDHAPNLVLLGSDDGGRNLPIFSFLIRFHDKFLHYNYVCALLNDLFGIQSRGGCQCAGPYSQRLLGLTEKTDDGSEAPNSINKDIENALLEENKGAELLRPGYTRLSLPFKGLYSAEVDYVLRALVWIAKNGWALMCQYRCNRKSGEWRHFRHQGNPVGQEERKLLHFVLSHKSLDPPQNPENPEDIRVTLERALKIADVIHDAAILDELSIIECLKSEALITASNDPNVEKLRWYINPREVAAYLSLSMQHSIDVASKTEIYKAGTVNLLSMVDTAEKSWHRSVREDIMLVSSHEQVRVHI